MFGRRFAGHRKYDRVPKTTLFLRRYAELLAGKDLFFNASAISFNLFLFSLPFSLLVGSIVGYVLSIDSVAEELTRYAREFMPEGLYEVPGAAIADPAVILEGMVRPLVDQRRVFGVVGFAVLFFTSIGLFRTLKHVIFQVFDGVERRGRVGNLAYNMLSFGLVGGLFVFFSYLVSIASLFVTGNVQLPLLGLSFGVATLYDVLLTLLSVAFTLGIFYVLFRYLGERLIARRTALVGAILYTLLFESARYLFGFFLHRTVEAYQPVYQGYTVLFILTLWAFYTAIIFVVAAAGARAFQDVFLEGGTE